MRPILPVILFMAVCGLTAQESAPPRNAALDYWAAFSLLPPILAERDPAEDLSSGITPQGSVTIPADARRFLTAAANTAVCDFGLHLEDGTGALIPWVTPQRRAVRLLSYMAWREPGQAHEWLALGFALARHAQQGKILIEIVAGNAFELKMLRDVTAAPLDADQRRSLLSSLAAAPPQRSFPNGMTGEIAMLAWFEAQLKGGKSFSIGEEKAPDDLKNPKTAQAALDSYRAWLMDLAAASSLPRPEQRVRVNAIADAGEKMMATNGVMALLMPAIRQLIRNGDDLAIRTAVVTCLLEHGFDASPQVLQASHPAIARIDAKTQTGVRSLQVHSSWLKEPLSITIGPRTLRPAAKELAGTPNPEDAPAPAGF